MTLHQANTSSVYIIKFVPSAISSVKNLELFSVLSKGTLKYYCKQRAMAQ